MGDYRIIKAQLPLALGLGGHNLLVLLDPDGNVVAELDGEATDANGASKPIGYLPSDRLMVKEHNGGIGGYYRPDLEKTTIASGDQKTITNFWNAARAAQEQINRLNLPYPSLGFGNNSNSVASTLIAAMGLDDAPIPGLPRLTPGAGNMLMEPEAIQNIQRQYDIKAPRSNVIPDTSSAPQSGNLPARAPQQSSPSLPVPGAKGPTSLGGPEGPATLVLPQLAPNRGKRSDIPGDVAPITAQATPTAWPLLAADPVLGKYVDAWPNAVGANSPLAPLPPADPNALPFPVPGIIDGDNVPERRLVGRVVNLSTPSTGAPPLAPDAQAAPQPLLGVYSGKPMPDWPVQPPIFQTKDQPSPEDNELSQRWMRWVNA